VSEIEDQSPNHGADAADDAALDPSEGRQQRGRRGTPPDVQRARLLAAAERCFAQTSFERTGIADIVREAGMSTRSFYQVFENKTAIAAALAEERAQDFLAGIEQIAARCELPGEAVEELLELFLANLPVVVVELHALKGPAGDRIREVLDRYRLRVQQLFMERFVPRFVEIGVPPPDPMALFIVMAGIEALTIQFQSQNRRDDLIALRPALLEALEELFPDQFQEQDQEEEARPLPDPH